MKNKTTHRIISLVLAVIMACALATGAFAASNSFADVKSSDWFYTACMYNVEHGMVSGTSDTTFTPSGTMTRGQFVTILARMEGVDTSANASLPSSAGTKLVLKLD